LERQVARVVRMIVAAVRVRLPDLDQRVIDGLAVDVDDASFEGDRVAADGPARSELPVVSQVRPICR